MNPRNINLIGEMNEPESAVSCINNLAEAEQRAATPEAHRHISLALIESLKKLPAIETETGHVHA